MNSKTVEQRLHNLEKALKRLQDDVYELSDRLSKRLPLTKAERRFRAILDDPRK